MKSKKIFSLLLAFMMLLSLKVVAYEEIQYDNIFDNSLIELVTPMKTEPGAPSEGAVLIQDNLVQQGYTPEGMYSFERFTRYSDGSYNWEYLFDFESYEVEKATNKYPAYIEGDTSGKYVGYIRTEEKKDNGTFYDIYLIDTTGEEVTTILIGSYLSMFNDETYERTYILYSTQEVSGAIERTPLSDVVLTEDDLWLLKDGTNYNDGLKFDRLSDDEYALSGYTDVNGKIYFEDPQVSYFNYFYNLGYLVTISNNGGELDYSTEDYEKGRIFWSSIENIFTGETCNFEDVDVSEIFDTGHVLVSVKDEARNETTYIGKLKKPAVIKVTVGGEKVLFDVLPTITEGRTLVPLRAIFEALGAEVFWDGDTQTVTATKGAQEVVLTIGSNQMLAGGEIKTLDVPARIVDGRTLVPARAIAEAFGCSVDWDGENRTVIIK